MSFFLGKFTLCTVLLYCTIYDSCLPHRGSLCQRQQSQISWSRALFHLSLSTSYSTSWLRPTQPSYWLGNYVCKLSWDGCCICHIQAFDASMASTGMQRDSLIVRSEVERIQRLQDDVFLKGCIPRWIAITGYVSFAALAIIVIPFLYTPVKW